MGCGATYTSGRGIQRGHRRQYNRPRLVSRADPDLGADVNELSTSHRVRVYRRLVSTGE